MPSGPIKAQDFTTQLYRDAGLGEPGVVGDVDGSSYLIRPPASITSRVLALGSDTQRSRLLIGGLFTHWIDAGARENVVEPVPEVSAPRRFLVVARFDPAQESRNPQGPTDLRLLAGPEGQPNTMPSHDVDDTGVSEEPLWTFVANPAQALSDITYTWVGRHLGPTLAVPPAAGLPTHVPIGTVVHLSSDGAIYVRRRTTEGAATWMKYARDAYTGGELPMVGPVPPAGTQRVRWVSGGLFDPNDLGAVNINLPGGMFPNGVVFASVVPGDTASDFAFFRPILANCTQSNINGIAHTITGERVTGLMRYVIHVEGW